MIYMLVVVITIMTRIAVEVMSSSRKGKPGGGGIKSSKWERGHLKPCRGGSTCKNQFLEPETEMTEMEISRLIYNKRVIFQDELIYHKCLFSRQEKIYNTIVNFHLATRKDGINLLL